jgi:hypothetical protein
METLGTFDINFQYPTKNKKTKKIPGVSITKKKPKERREN